jgi:hypothetical protein
MIAALSLASAADGIALVPTASDQEAGVRTVHVANIKGRHEHIAVEPEALGEISH